MSFVHTLFGFHGRINRAQYWLYNVAASVGGILLLIAAELMFGGSKATIPFVGLLFLLVMAALTWVGLALQVKRFHDRGRSGYWALAPMLPLAMIFSTMLGGVASGATPESLAPQVMPWFGLSMLIGLWFFVDLGLLAGADGPNKYGDPPGSAPSSPTVPSASAKSATLGGAASAMERAISSQGKAKPQTAPSKASPPVRTAPPPARAPANSPGAVAFGRKGAH